LRANFFYGWVVVAATTLCLFTFSVFEVYGVFFKPLMEEFGWSRAVASSVFSLYAISHSFSAVLMGHLSDKHGSRKVIMFGGILVGLGLILSSSVESVWHLYLFWGIASFGSSGLWVPPISTVVKWFEEKKGLAVGVANSGYGLGILSMAPIAAILTSTYGWRGALVTLGFALLGIITFAAFLMKNHANSDGLKVRARKQDPLQVSLSTKQAVFTRSFLILYGIYFFGSLCFTSLLVHLVPFATDAGISSVMAALALGLMGGSTIAGSPAVGAVSDKVGKENMLVACLAAQAVVFVGLLWVDDVWMLYVFAVVFGFSAAGVWALVAPLVEETFGPDKIGLNLGALTTTFGVGGILGPILLGYAFDVTGSYRPGLIFCLFITVGAVLLAYLLKRQKSLD
jgi:MFS family permease